MGSENTYEDRVTTVSFRCDKELKAELDSLLEEEDVTHREWVESRIQETQLEYAEAIEKGKEMKADEVSEKLEAKDRSLREFRAKITRQSTQIEDLMDRLAFAKDQNHRLETQLKKAETRVEALEEEVEHNATELEGARSSLEDCESEVEILRDLLVEDLAAVEKKVQTFEEAILEGNSKAYNVGRIDGMKEGIQMSYQQSNEEQTLESTMRAKRAELKARKSRNEALTRVVHTGIDVVEDILKKN